MFAVGAFSDQWWSLAISICIWGVATWMVLRGAWLGSRSHAWPRFMYGLGTLWLTVVYALDLFAVISTDTFRTWTRGLGWYLGVTISLTAWTGVRYGKKVEHVAKEISGMAEERPIKDGGVG